MEKHKPVIMVVEDEELLSDLIVAIGDRSGWSIVVFSHVEPAIQSFRDNPGRYDIALIDICLGDDWGPDLAKMIRKSNPDFKIIFMTGSEDDLIKRALVEVPGAPVIKKPFKLMEFRDQIRSTLIGCVITKVHR